MLLIHAVFLPTLRETAHRHTDTASSGGNSTQTHTQRVVEETAHRHTYTASNGENGTQTQRAVEAQKLLSEWPGQQKVSQADRPI